MTEEQQNLALDQWLFVRTGRKTMLDLDSGVLHFQEQSSDDVVIFDALGLFTASLDAMALVQNAMTDDERHAYTDAFLRHHILPLFHANPQRNEQEYLFATAAQRAEAACRALGLDGKETTNRDPRT